MSNKKSHQMASIAYKQKKEERNEKNFVVRKGV